jgi:hypothetical protein
MIPILAAGAHDGWHHLVTEGESCFSLSYSPCRMWTLSRDHVPTKPKHDVCTQKFLFTVIWNPLGFQVVDKLTTGAKMNSDYFITNILEPLEQKIFPNGRKPHAKRLTVHLEFAPEESQTRYSNPSNSSTLHSSIQGRLKVSKSQSCPEKVPIK